MVQNYIIHITDNVFGHMLLHSEGSWIVIWA